MVTSIIHRKMTSVNSIHQYNNTSIPPNTKIDTVNDDDRDLLSLQ